MDELELTLDDTAIRIEISQIRKNANDIRPALKLVAFKIAQQITHKFVTSDEGQWNPNAKGTRKSNKLQPPLIDSGNLLLAAIATEEGVENSDFQITPFSLLMGVTRKDVYSHLFGNPRTGEPARDWMPNESELDYDVVFASVVIEEHLMRGL